MKKHITLAALCGLLTGVAELTASAPFGEADAEKDGKIQTLNAHVMVLENELVGARERGETQTRALEDLESRMLGLAGENRELRGELETLRPQFDTQQEQLAAAIAQLAEIRAENAKLQASSERYEGIAERAIAIVEKKEIGRRAKIEAEEAALRAEPSFDRIRTLAQLLINPEQSSSLPQNQTARAELNAQGIEVPEAAR